MFLDCCLLFAVSFVLCVVCCLLLVVCCSLFLVGCSLLKIGCFLFVVCCFALFVVCCYCGALFVLFGVYCFFSVFVWLLFVVRGLGYDVC